MTFRDNSRATIHRPPEADANSLDRMCLNEAGLTNLDLLQNPGGAPARVDVMSNQCGELTATAATDAKLQLRAADFDAEIHFCLGIVHPRIYRIALPRHR